MADSNSDSESDIDQICMHLGFSDGRAIRTTVPPAPPENRRHANTSIVAILVVRTRPAPAALLGLIRNDVTSPQQYVGVHKVIDLEAGSRGA